MVAALSITPTSGLQQHHSLDHSPLSADRRPSTLCLGGPPSRGKGTSCAAGSGGTSLGDRGYSSRRDTELGPGRPCSPLPCGTSWAADLGYHTGAGSLLSTGGDLGTWSLWTTSSGSCYESSWITAARKHNSQLLLRLPTVGEASGAVTHRRSLLDTKFSSLLSGNCEHCVTITQQQRAAWSFRLIQSSFNQIFRAFSKQNPGIC